MTPPTFDTKVHDFLSHKRIAMLGMQTLEGARCYPDFQSIPGGVEGVVIITRPEITERIVRDCAEA